MDFSEIYNEAVIRAGSHKKLMELLPKPCSSDLLSKISDDRYLSTMARCIFRAGFVWRVVELWRQMKKEGSRLGGMTGPLVLRIIGKDTFLATNDVLVALKKYGYIKTHSNGSMKDLFRLQEIFNEISKEIKMPLCQISKIFALSTLR